MLIFASCISAVLAIALLFWCAFTAKPLWLFVVGVLAVLGTMPLALLSINAVIESGQRERCESLGAHRVDVSRGAYLCVTSDGRIVS